jgi:hypothetical protein
MYGSFHLFDDNHPSYDHLMLENKFMNLVPFPLNLCIKAVRVSRLTRAPNSSAVAQQPRIPNSPSQRGGQGQKSEGPVFATSPSPPAMDSQASPRVPVPRRDVHLKVAQFASACAFCKARKIKVSLWLNEGWNLELTRTAVRFRRPVWSVRQTKSHFVLLARWSAVERLCDTFASEDSATKNRD